MSPIAPLEREERRVGRGGTAPTRPSMLGVRNRRTARSDGFGTVPVTSASRLRSRAAAARPPEHVDRERPLRDNDRMKSRRFVTDRLARPGMALAGVVALAACSASARVAGPADPVAVTAIRTTTSFGFCLGYCRATLEVTASGMTLVEESTRGDLPPVRRTAEISPSEWRQLTESVS